MEPNDTLATAQNVDVFFDLVANPQIEDASGFNTSTTDPHAELVSIGDNSGTLDFIAFTAFGGETITIDVDCADGDDGTCPAGNWGGGEGDLDTVITLYDPAGLFVLVNDDCGSIPPGSPAPPVDTGTLFDCVPGGVGTFDSFLVYTVPLPEGGLYTVKIDDVFRDGVLARDDYILNITVVPEPGQLLMLAVGIAALVTLKSWHRRAKDSRLA
jgi:hypothetical protein